MMGASRRIVGALVLSFAVYLTPLVGPHAAWLLGEVVWRELGPESRRWHSKPLWAATDIAVALGAQLVFFILLYWFFKRPGWLRGLCVLAPVLPAIVAMNFLYMAIAMPRESTSSGLSDRGRRSRMTALVIDSAPR